MFTRMFIENVYYIYYCSVDLGKLVRDSTYCSFLNIKLSVTDIFLQILQSF